MWAQRGAAGMAFRGLRIGGGKRARMGFGRVRARARTLTLPARAERFADHAERFADLLAGEVRGEAGAIPGHAGFRSVSPVWRRWGGVWRRTVPGWRLRCELAGREVGAVARACRATALGLQGRHWLGVGSGAVSNRKGGPA